MRKQLFYLFLSLVSSSAIFAQDAQITGALSQENTEKSIDGAAIKLIGLKQGSISDAKGRFVLKNVPYGEQTLEISHLGFTTKTLSILVNSKTIKLGSILLKEDVQELEEAVVSGRSLTGGERGIRELAGSAHYLGLKTLETHKYNDINRLLRSVPGVYIQEEDGFGLRPNIGMRGSGLERSSKITLMEDGVLAAPAPYTAPAAYYFPTTGRMEGIEVRKGSSQIEYGPYTTGGALNFISTQIPKNFRGKLDVLAGNYGQRRLHAHAGESFKNFGFVVETYQASADGFKELDNGGNTGFDLQDYQAKFKVNSSAEAKIQQSLQFKIGQTISNSNETYLGLSKEDFEANPYRRYAASGLDRIESEQRQFGLQYVVRPNKNLSVNVNAYRSTFGRNWYKSDKVKGENGSISLAPILDDPSSYADSYQSLIGNGEDTIVLKNNNRDYYSQGLQAAATYQWGEGSRFDQKLKAGLRYHEDGVDRFQWTDDYIILEGNLALVNPGTPGTESNRLEDAQAWATFVEYELSWRKWTISPGLRYENIVLNRSDYGKKDIERNGSSLKERSNQVDVLIPGFGIRYDRNAKQQFFAGIHKGFSPPGSTPDALPEASINLEIGSRLNYKNLKVQAVSFYNQYQRLLGTDMAATGGLGNNQLYNGGNALVWGLELEASSTIGASWKQNWSFPVALAYTYTSATFNSDFDSDFDAWGEVESGDRMPYIAQHMLNAQISANYRKFSFNSTTNFTSEMQSQAGLNLEEDLVIPGQWNCDLSLSYDLNYNVSVFASLRNAFDAVNLVAMRPAGLRPNMPRSYLIGLKARI
jgi:Fe(3+) dicitrate transport protein